MTSSGAFEVTAHGRPNRRRAEPDEVTPMKQSSRPLHVLTLAILAAFPWSPAHAQASTNTAAAKGDGGQLQEIIVTGTRRLENIKEVPQSISAISSETLEVINASGLDVRVLSGRVPSLNIESDFGRTFPRFYIRGLGNTDFDLNASQPVGLVFDEVVQESPILKGFPLFDMEQVEVLRGPQGTLFGRNSPAGVMKFDSAKPSRRFEGYGTIGFGRFSAVNAEAALNVPVSDDWALRTSLLSQSAASRVHNPRPTGEQNLEGYHDTAARAQVSYKNGGFNALLGLHGRDYKGNATLFRANIIQKGTNDLVNGFDPAFYPTDGLNSQTLRSDGVNARLRWELDGVTLHSITAYDHAKYYSRGDVDGGYGAVFLPNSQIGGKSNPAVMGPAYPGQDVVIPFPAETADGIPSLKQMTQEFRVESRTKDALQWLAGLYFFSEKLQVDSFDYNSFAPGNPQDGYAVQHQTAKSYAVFGSLNYAISPELKVRGGVRYTDDKKDFDAIGGFNNLPLITAHPKANNTSWDVGANYALDSATSLFARVATGYRAPSIQGRVLFGTSISIAKPEKALSVEAGFKSDLLNKTLRLSATAFSYSVTDLQLTAGSGSVNQNQLVNAKKATGQGFELEAQAILAREWRTTLGLSYNDTQIKDPNLFVAPCGGGCTVTNPAGPVAGTVLIGGNPLPRAPKWVANWTLRYSTEVANGNLFVLTDWAYKDKYNMFLYEAKEYTAKALLEGGLRVGYGWAEGRYEIAAYSRNITDRRQVVAAIDFNNLTGIINEPRSYGVQLRVNF
jgi:iron complex outermembrane receptor protein